MRRRAGRKNGRKAHKTTGRPTKGQRDITARTRRVPSSCDTRYWSCLPRGFSIRRANFRENVSRMPAAPHNCRFKGYNSKERQRGMRGGREGGGGTRWKRDEKGAPTVPRDLMHYGVKGGETWRAAFGLLTKWKLPVIFSSSDIWFRSNAIRYHPIKYHVGIIIAQISQMRPLRRFCIWR